MSIPEVFTRLKQHSTLTSNKMQMIKIISIITLYIKDLHTIIRHNNKRMTEKNILWYHPNFVARKTEDSLFFQFALTLKNIAPLYRLRPYLYVSWYYFIALTERLASLSAGFQFHHFIMHGHLWQKLNWYQKQTSKAKAWKKDVRLPLGLSKSFDLFRK